MHFNQYYLDCLSHASYLIGDESTGRAVVVDPRRDIDEYVADARKHGLQIELVIETHFHADFLSGHLELAAATGSEIGYGEVAQAEFPIRKLRDGERISLGDVTLEIRATPGHTPESISVVVYEKAGDEVPYGVLTGDTLFIGDVGRPDLLASLGVTAGDLASQLYDSLREKLLTLPDDTRVFPAHGAGSACGKNLSTETQSTIGEQRRTNYALAPMDRAAFVDIVTEGQPTAPGYFGYDAVLNRQERSLFEREVGVKALVLDEVLSLQAGGAVVVDTREAGEFAAGHLRGAVNVGIGGRFAEYVGSVVRPEDRIVLITEDGTETEAVTRLARIGFDRVLGYLEHPLAAIAAAPEHDERTSRLSVSALRERMDDVDGLQIVDVRNIGEYALGSIPGARNISLASLKDRLGELDPTAPTIVNCAGGYRSMIGASLLSSAGFADVSDVLGGWAAWTAESADTAVTA